MLGCNLGLMVLFWREPMRFRLQVAFKAGILLLVSQHFVSAQEPLRVEIVGSSHPNLAPIVVRVTNVTLQSLDLPVPYNVQKNARESFRNPLPIDVEKFENGDWVACRPLKQNGIGRKIGPGKTIEFTLGVLGAGQYRARVWYTIDHGDPSPPARSPVFGSVVSQPFSVLPNPTN
jgi:hypothetical protein